MGEIPFGKRLLWLLAAAAIQSVYIPASQATSGGIAPKLPFEPLPTNPVWVIPYYFTFLFWAFGVYWALFKLDDRAFRAAIAAALLVVSIGAATFVLFPTYVDLPLVSGADVFSALLRFVQLTGGTHAALPSGHNYVSMLIAAFGVHYAPRWRWLWILIIALISVSTVLTGQHYILDALTGLALGWLGFRFGLWQAARKNAGA